MDIKLDQWATTPPSGYPGAVSPPPAKRVTGFANGEEPPAGYFNLAFDALADTQNELANLISGAGLTRSESNLSQVLAAINKLVNRRAEIGALTQWTEIGSLPSAVLGIACSAFGDTVAVCASTPSPRFATTLDTWGLGNLSSSGYAGIFQDVCWSAAFSKFYVVGAGGEIQSASSSGGSYTRRYTGGPDWLKCAAGANAVIAMDAAGGIVSTTDGTTFTSTNVSFPGLTMSAGAGLAYSPTLNRFCAYGQAGFGVCSVYLSDQNGANWVPATTPPMATSSGRHEIEWSAEAGCFITDYGFKSSDGLVWTQLPIAGVPGSTGGFRTIAVLPEHLLVVVSGSGIVTTPPNFAGLYKLDDLAGPLVTLNLRFSPCVAGDAFSRVIRIPPVAGMQYAGRLLGLCSSGRIRVSGYVG